MPLNNGGESWVRRHAQRHDVRHGLKSERSSLRIGILLYCVLLSFW